MLAHRAHKEPNLCYYEFSYVYTYVYVDRLLDFCFSAFFSSTSLYCWRFTSLLLFLFFPDHTTPHQLLYSFHKISLFAATEILQLGVKKCVFSCFVWDNRQHYRYVIVAQKCFCNAVTLLLCIVHYVGQQAHIPAGYSTIYIYKYVCYVVLGVFHIFFFATCLFLNFFLSFFVLTSPSSYFNSLFAASFSRSTSARFSLIAWGTHARCNFSYYCFLRVD